MSRTFDPISLKIVWDRLIAIVEEASVSLKRAAFSTIVRESNDFACVLLDRQCNALAQSKRSVPSFIGTPPHSLRHFLAKYPRETLLPGDAIICNDPWICTGHVGDLTIATPIFLKDQLFAFAVSVAHSPDMGGLNMAAEARDIYEEGLRIPIVKLLERGKPNETLLDMMKTNVRVPDYVMGDLFAQLAANDIMSKRLISVIEEYAYGIDDFDALSNVIISISEAAMRQSIREMPKGVYRAEIKTDGYDQPVTIKIAITIEDSDIRVDYTGTDPQCYWAINTVMNYTYAYTAFPIKCIVNSQIPNNQGCFRPIHVFAPEGSLVNPKPPAAVGARSQIGHFFHAAVFRALSQVIPEKVQGESGACPIWSGNFSSIGVSENRFTHKLVANGGQGASASKDGISCSPYPSNISNVPVEVTESITGLWVESKELIQDSGGDGKFRGGLGQRVAVKLISDTPAMLRNNCDRTKSPEHRAFGVAGGYPGSTGKVMLNGEVLRNPKERKMLHPQNIMIYETPGGGGYGPPNEREKQKVIDDLRNGYISIEKARSVYGLDEDLISNAMIGVDKSVAL